MANLAVKYRPDKFEDLTEQTVICDMLKSICETTPLDCRNFLLIGPAGCGKANPLYTRVLTEFGYRKMGELKIGDKVYTRQGDLAYISGIFPQGKKHIYQITLDDGTYIRVSDGHLNIVYRMDIKTGKKQHMIKNTLELLDLFKNKYMDLYIDTPSVYWEGTFPVSPYDVGKDKGQSIEAYQYTESDFSFRVKLLQGVLDQYGYVDEYGVCTFDPVNEAVCDKFAFLARSLGIKVKINIDNSDIDSRYSCKLYPPSNINLFTSAPKLDKLKFNYLDNNRKIIDISYVDVQECQCISVLHDDHSYICEDFVPTHNTTSARIMASMLNKGDGDPIEIDAASHNGVDSIREIVQQARTYPVGCEWKVFIIDEVHSLSNQAWQVLLKTLEENPAKSVFIMCTTNPEKIPQTILSRVQTFQLSKISLLGIENRLKYVISCENKEGRNITYTDEAINYIAKMAQGGMRDSLTLLDKALAYSNDITSENLAISLNLPKYDDFFDLLSSYVKKDNQRITAIVNDVYNSGVNFVKWFTEFHSFVMNIFKYIYLKDINQTMIPSYYIDRIRNYSEKHSAICLKLANKLIKMNSDLRTTQYLQETALTYLCSTPQK